jgi:hypothetical protein
MGMSMFSKAGTAIRTMNRNRIHKRAGGTGEAPNFNLVGGPTTNPSALIDDANKMRGQAYANRLNPKVGEGLGFTKGAKAIGNYGYNNFRNSVGGDMGDVAKWAAGRAGRGAVVGGAVGGTAEAGQGGSFWSGAKAGAFNGAVGWTAYRGAGHAFAGGSKNPGKVLGGFGNSFGLISADATKMASAGANATKAQRGQMSKSVQAIMKNQQNTQTAKGMM